MEKKKYLCVTALVGVFGYGLYGGVVCLYGEIKELKVSNPDEMEIVEIEARNVEEAVRIAKENGRYVVVW